MKKTYLLLVLAIILSSCTKTVTEEVATKETVEPLVVTNKPKNIILLIGDGMGISQITAGIYTQDKPLNLERFQHIGLHKTYSSSHLITDSAAGATAFSCGIKTYNGAIGVDQDTVAQKTILEHLEEKGFATGLIASSSIVHATPASFYAHNEYRKNYEEIAKGLLQVEVDYFVGGGRAYFQSREDKRDLIDELKDRGYDVYDNFHDDFKTSHPSSKNYGFLTANKEPIPRNQGREYMLTAFDRALQFLNKRSDKGFFLMTEGSQIDWGGHANNGPYVVDELLEFDKIVGRALDFAEREGNTLVIVTADHETGGLAINKESERGNLTFAFTSDYHTADLIPVFAYGPTSEKFQGIYENTAIYDKMKFYIDNQN